MDLHPKQFVRVNVKSIQSEGVETIVDRHFIVDPRTITLDRLRHLVARALDVRGEFCVTCLRSDGCGDAVPLSCDWDLEGALSEQPRIDLALELQPKEPGLEEWDIICPADVPVAGHEASCTPQPRKGSFLEQVIQLCKPLNNSRLPLSESEFASLADWPCPLRYAVYRAGGAEPNLRPALWMHLLDVYPTGAGHEEREEFLNRKAEEYYGLRHSWQKLVQADAIPAVLRDVTCLVRKDVRRTDRLLDLDERALYNVLTTYAVHHPSVAYCQGMSDLLSPLLHVMKTEARAYVAFCGLMQRMRDNFRRDGRSMRTKFRHLRRALRTHDPPLHEHLAKCGALDLLFCYRWLLLDLKREFPYQEMLRLMEVLWSTLRPAHREKGVELYEVRFPTAEIRESLRMDIEDEFEEHHHTEEEDTSQRRRRTIGRCPFSDEPKRKTRDECRSVRRTTTTDDHDSHRTPTDHSEVPQTKTTDEFHSEDADSTTLTDEHDSEDSQRTRDDSEVTRKKTTDKLDSGRTARERFHLTEGTRRSPESAEDKRDGIVGGLPSRRTASCPTSVSLKRWAMLSRRQSIAQNIESEDCSSSSSTDDDPDKGDPDSTHEGLFRPRRRRRRCRSWETATRRRKEEEEDFSAGRHETIYEMPLVDDWLEQSAERRRHGSSDSNYGSNFSDEDEDTSPSSARSRSEGYDSEHRTLTDHSSRSTSSEDDDYEEEEDGNLFAQSVDSADTYHNGSQNRPQRPPRLLPGPTRFGDGKPFLVFLCLTMLANHRDAILRDDMDASEIGIHFDKLVRGHRLGDVLPGARQLFAEYLRTGWTEDD